MNTNYIKPNIANTQFTAPVQKTNGTAGTSLAAKNEADFTNNVKYASLSVLGGIGLAFVFRNKISKAMDIYYNSIKKSSAHRKAVNVDMVPNVLFSGPSINISGSKTSISDAWNNYIDTVEKRITSNQCNYKKIFTDNKEALDKFEEVADKKIQARLVQVA